MRVVANGLLLVSWAARPGHNDLGFNAFRRAAVAWVQTQTRQFSFERRRAAGFCRVKQLAGFVFVLAGYQRVDDLQRRGRYGVCAAEFIGRSTHRNAGLELCLWGAASHAIGGKYPEQIARGVAEFTETVPQ